VILPLACAAALIALDAYLPPAADLDRFPCPAVVTRAMLAGDRWRRFCEGAVAFETREPDRLQRTTWETRRRWWVWSRLRDCHSAQGWLRRVELERLRRMLGDEAYQLGVMPCPVP
jgi:hypothetical protein